MKQQVQINTDEETVEIPLAEYKAVMEFSIAIGEQNSTVLDSIQALVAAQIQQGENLVAIFASLRDAIAGLQITVNVPEQPPAQITVNVPEQAAAVVNLDPNITLKMPPEKKRKITATVKRDKNGAISGIEGTTE